jgi:serine/threonine-protein kinase
MEEKLGKYQLLERLGGGGMAEVFRARLTGPAGFEKLLALKWILPHFSNEPEFVQMFIHEATLAARLDHANIVRIQEFDRIDDRYFIAMEWVDGKDLRAVLAQSRAIGRPLGVGEAVLIAGEVARGLAFAHGELTPGAPEIIHRDISPHNLMLSRAGEVKITDFGIAKLASSASLTRTGTVKGKLAYMSPEQACGDVLDKRSDLFSLGCVLWELLTGQRLFAAPNELATLESLKNGPIHPPSAHNPAVPPGLDELALHLLARDREARCSSASELVRRIEPDRKSVV